MFIYSVRSVGRGGAPDHTQSDSGLSVVNTIVILKLPVSSFGFFRERRNTESKVFKDDYVNLMVMYVSTN